MPKYQTGVLLTRDKVDACEDGAQDVSRRARQSVPGVPTMNRSIGNYERSHVIYIGMMYVRV